MLERVERLRPYASVVINGWTEGFASRRIR